MIHPHSAAFASLLLLLLNICFSVGKRTNVPSESEWGSIKSFDTSDLERTMAKAKAMAKLRRQMKSHGPVVHNENVGGGANGTIDGGAGDSSSTNGNDYGEEWGSIESIDTSDLDRIMAKERAMAKLRSEMESHGPIVHNDGPIVHNENVGGGANGTIDGGAGNEAVGGGEGAVGGEKSGDSSSTNGNDFVAQLDYGVAGEDYDKEGQSGKGKSKLHHNQKKKKKRRRGGHKRYLVSGKKSTNSDLASQFLVETEDNQAASHKQEPADKKTEGKDESQEDYDVHRA